MQITDPIADMLTRIRNANNAKHDTVDVPASNMKKAIAQILLDEGYIKNFQIINDGTQGVIRITLKYLQPGKEKVTYVKMTPEKAKEIVEKHIKGGKIVEEYTIGAAK